MKHSFLSIIFVLALTSCDKIIIYKEGRIDIETIGATLIYDDKAIVEGEISITGELPKNYTISGEGFIYGTTSSGLEIKTHEYHTSNYNNIFNCFQSYIYHPQTTNVIVQNIQITNTIEKDDGSLSGYEFQELSRLGHIQSLLIGLAYGTRYYVRAFVHITNHEEEFNKYFYGNIVEFISDGISQDPTVFTEVKVLNIGVMKTDTGTAMGGFNAERLCSNINFYDGIGGYHDWRLPTLDELQEIYKLRNQIGNFKNEKYWSSTVYGNAPYYYFWDFDKNISGHQEDTGTFAIWANIRLVRTLNKE